MQWIDWEYMEQKNDQTFKAVIAACEEKKIKNFMSLKCNWSVEVIAQFYATLSYDHEENQSMFWMIEGEKYRISYQTFTNIFGLDVRDLHNSKIHNENQLSLDDIDLCTWIEEG